MKSKLSKVILFFALMSLGFAGWCAAADLYIITNSGINVMPSDVREIFLGEKQFSGSAKLVPVDNAAAQERFLSKVMNMSVTAYNASWTKKSFRDGLTPPALKSSDAEVIEFVRRTPGAIGYVSSNPNNVNVVQKF